MNVETALKFVQADPPNAETPLSALTQPITPSELFYVRCNFTVPVVDPDEWRLEIAGLVDRPTHLRLDELRSFGATDVTAVLECAGNGRRLMSPIPPGTAWDLGAVSSATFTGVALRTMLERCGVHATTQEIVFAGADGGPLPDGRRIQFERSLPLARALATDVILAWAMNGEPLTREHGFPLRLVVPGYYAVASVKWLERITAIDTRFDGHFQAERYVYRADPRYADETPVREMQVRSLIGTPADNDEVGDQCSVRGVAWSGQGDITAVEISDDGGSSWTRARLTPPATPTGPTRFEYDWTPPAAGTRELIVRASDSSGAVQPLESVWNELGYANNVAHRIRVNVRG